MNDFVRERDAAFIHFVKTDDMSKVRAYCKKYGVQIPKKRNVMAAGVYKAVVALLRSRKTSERWQCRNVCGLDLAH